MDSQPQQRHFDWRWVVVGFCSLLILQLFPSYFLFGLRRMMMTSTDGSSLMWFGLGVAIVAATIGSRSNGYPFIEGLSVALLYFLVYLFLNRGALRPFVPHMNSRMRLTFIALFFALFVIGAIAGKLARLRRERRQKLAAAP